MHAQNFGGVISLEITVERCTEQAPPHFVPHNGNTVEIAFHGVARQSLESGFRPENLGGPIRLGIKGSEQAEQRLANAKGQHRPHALLIHMPAVPAVPGQIFIAAIPGQGNRYALPGQLADTVSGHCRTIGKRLIV